jgi:hypothetical protein
MGKPKWKTKKSKKSLPIHMDLGKHPGKHRKGEVSINPGTGKISAC